MMAVPIMHNNVRAWIENEPLTAMESTKLVVVIAVHIPAPAKIAHIRAVGPPVHAPVHAPLDSIHVPVDLSFDPGTAIEIAAGRLGDRGRSADQ